MPTPSRSFGRARHSTDRSPLRAAARTTALAAVVTVAIPAAAAAYGGAGAFDPANAATPAKYPGTNTTIESWKLVGSGLTGNPAVPRTASQNLIAPRWVIGSRHSALQVGNTYVSPDGQTSTVQAVYLPTQRVDRTAPNGEEGGDWAPDGAPDSEQKVDVSLALLSTPISAPASGYPKLLDDRITDDSLSVLDGWVLWSGMFGTSSAGQVRSGWTTPVGAPDPGLGAIEASHGDSGSAGAWLPTASSSPIISSITQSGSTNLRWGRNVRLAVPLKPSTTESYPTLADWIRAKVALHPATTAALAHPQWTTFAGAGQSLATKRPPAPRVRVSAATPTSITFAWDPPSDARTSTPTSYRVTFEPGGIVRTFGANERTTTFYGLATGTRYGVGVEAINAYGTSKINQATVPYAGYAAYDTRPNPPKPTITSATARRVIQAGVVNYCVDVDATSPRYTPAPLQNRGVVGTIDGTAFARVSETEASQDDQTATVSRYALTLCSPNVDLDPATEHSLVLRTTDGQNVSTFAITPFTTPAGPAAGTVLPAPTNVQLTPRRAVKDGKVDYCADITWTNPTSIAGFPHTSTGVLITATGIGDYAEDLGTSVDEHTFCSLKPGLTYTATVFAETGAATTSAKKVATMQAGAPQGTLFPAATGFTKSTRKRGPGDYCVKATWTNPAPLLGFDRGESVLIVATGNFSVYQDETVGPTATSAEICGLPGSTNFLVAGGLTYPVPIGDPGTVSFPFGGATTPA